MSKMRKIYAILSVVLGVITANAQDIKTVGGFSHPESVVSDGTFLYVADIGSAMKPGEKDGDGKILKVDKDGKIIDAAYIKETLSAPKGLALEGGILFVNDIDKLLAFDLKTAKKLYEIDFSSVTSFLNDITVFDKNTLYVSATDKNKIFKVNLTDKTFSELAVDKVIVGMNGLFYDKVQSRLYVNGFGSGIGYVNLKDNKFTTITPLEGYYDGVYAYEDVLYFTNWVAFEKKGIVVAIEVLNNNKVTVLRLPEPISGPADFTVFRDHLVVPGMLDGTLNFISIKKELLYIH
ncbi:hypothetical protein [Flavobacterium sp. GCM10027622]|uniref:hypothetical protein n=1 Tax=unclassified Flavobacterium TaxID=196869 RepID=UPI0036172F21